MKLNWGTSIAIVLILFAISMAYFVKKAMEQDFDLVSENYYLEELEYQTIIDQKSNALGLEGKAQLSFSEEGFLLQLPDDFSTKEKTIKTQMYCELEADKDFHFETENTSKNAFQIPVEKFHRGKWIAKTHVRCEGVDYYFEPEIIL